MMSLVSKRVLSLAGAIVAVAAAVGLGLYFAAVGLARADKLASVLGAFVGLAGLALALFSYVLARRATSAQTMQPASRADNPDHPPVTVHNEIIGNQYGSVVQAGEISGSVTFDGRSTQVPDRHTPDN
jgi:membrane protein implicated in regulation of membrane protease activity